MAEKLQAMCSGSCCALRVIYHRQTQRLDWKLNGIIHAMRGSSVTHPRAAALARPKLRVRSRMYFNKDWITAGFNLRLCLQSFRLCAVPNQIEFLIRIVSSLSYTLGKVIRTPLERPKAPYEGLRLRALRRIPIERGREVPPRKALGGTSESAELSENMECVKTIPFERRRRNFLRM